MSLPNWPSTLPPFQLSNSGYQRGNVFKRWPFADGRSRVQQISESEPDTYTATLLMTAEQNAVFEGFLHHQLQDGERWFTTKIKKHSTVIDAEVCLVPPLSGGQLVNGFNVQRQLRLRVK